MSRSGLLSASSEAHALEQLHELCCTDGLPVVIPTVERVERFVLASGHDSDLVLGEMGPGGGAATISKVAAAAVMAGCLPDHVPVVVAAVRAVLDPRFDLTEMQATTHCTAPFLIVNGPLVKDLGIASGFGALGPGHRANAAIGRALRLALINIGGGRPGSSDMALLGHPGKFTYCLAENEAQSPFEPLHVALGFDAQDSVVTVIGAEAPQSVIFIADGDDPGAADRLLLTLARSLTHVGTNNAILRGGMAVVVLNPDHAQLLAQAGHTRVSICERLVELAVLKRSELELLMPPGRLGGLESESASPDDVIACFNAPDDILVLMAGGAGLYSMVMPTWCAGPHRNRATSQVIETGQACEVPWARAGSAST